MLQREKYRKDGFLHPLTIFPKEKMTDLYARYRDYVQRYGAEDGMLSGSYRNRPHVVARWAREIAMEPKLVDVVKEVLDTENVLLWDSGFWIKRPRSEGFFSWHQDGFYAGHSSADDVLTAWVALTPASAEAGCMQFCSGSHLSQLPHHETRDPNNFLVIGQTISEENMENLNKPVAAPLEAGQVKRG
jgi:chlorinating enzyme